MTIYDRNARFFQGETPMTFGCLPYKSGARQWLALPLLVLVIAASSFLPVQAQTPAAAPTANE